MTIHFGIEFFWIAVIMLGICGFTESTLSDFRLKVKDLILWKRFLITFARVLAGLSLIPALIYMISH